MAQRRVARPWPPDARQVTFAFLWLFVLTVPWLGVVSFSFLGSSSRLAGIGLALAAAYVILRYGRTRRLLDTHVLAIAFTLWVLASLAWTIDDVLTLLTMFTMAQLLVALLCMWEFAQTRAQQLSLLRAFVVGAGVACLGVVFEYLSGAEVATRYTIEGANPNGLAFSLCLAVPTAWYLAEQARTTRGRWFFRFYIPLGVLAIVLTSSRSTLVVVAFALLIIPASFEHVPRMQRVAIVAACILSVALGLLVVPDEPLARLATLDNEVSTGDLSGRSGLWAAGMQLFGEQPLNGVGAGASRVGIFEIAGERQGAHNTLLSIAAELGAVGLALFLLLLLTIGRRALAMEGFERKFVVILLATLVLGLLPRHWEYDKGTWVTIGLLVGHITAFTDRRPRPSLEDGYAGQQRLRV